MENNNAGLKFTRFRRRQIFVDNDKNTNVDCFRRLTMEEQMLYNFKQMERFCRLGKENYIDKDENYFIKYYIVLKDFSDVVTPGEVTAEYIIFQAGKSNAICDPDIFTVFRNGSGDRSKGFVSIEVKNPFCNSSSKRIYQKVVCYISVIDNQGNERFTQTTVFVIPEQIFRNERAKFEKFISRETMLCNAHELLHYDDLVLCMKLEFRKYSDVEIEKKIVRFFENVVPYNTEVGEKTNDLFEECLHFDQDFFFDSDIGKILCNYSFFFKSRLNYSRLEAKRRSVVIPYNECVHLINICRILIGNYIIVEATSAEICELYKLADKYGIPRVMEFCRPMLKQHVCSHNIRLIQELAETLNDTELKTIVDSFLADGGKFICDLLYIDCHGVDEKSDLEHLHNAFGGYLECDNRLELKREYCSFHFNYEEMDCKLNFSSIFSKNEDEELTLALESDFGKLLRQKSDSLNRQIEHCLSEKENQILQIVKKDIEPLKNMYRLLMGRNYIKASTIYDIICLYELSDSYGISLLMDICRNLFERYICCRNKEPICKLAEMYPDDFELKTIVETFQTEYTRYRYNQIERGFKTGRYFESKNFDIPNEEYDFYK